MKTQSVKKTKTFDALATLNSTYAGKSKNWTVAVFDDRSPGHPLIALRNVKLALSERVSADDACAKALALTYTDVSILKEHCTHAFVYPSDAGGYVIDGEYFIPFLFREKKEAQNAQETKKT